MPGSRSARQLRKIAAILGNRLLRHPWPSYPSHAADFFYWSSATARGYVQFYPKTASKAVTGATTNGAVFLTFSRRLITPGGWNNRRLGEQSSRVVHYRRTDMRPPTHRHSDIRHRRPIRPGRSALHGHYCGRRGCRSPVRYWSAKALPSAKMISALLSQGD